MNPQKQKMLHSNRRLRKRYELKCHKNRRPIIKKETGEREERVSEYSENVLDDCYSEVVRKDAEDMRCEAFKFSCKFFSQGITKQIEHSGLLAENLNQSGYLKKIQELQIKDRAITTTNEDGVLDIMSKIYEGLVVKAHGDSMDKDKLLGKHIIGIVEEQYKDSEKNGDGRDDEYVLFMQGPVGSYKNRLLQYVYLCLCGMFADETSKKAPVFYIDFSKYEPGTNSSFSIEKDIETIKKLIDESQVPPLFILDNVRGFKCGKNSEIYAKFTNEILNKKIKIIVGHDNNFNQIADRREQLRVKTNEYKNCIYIKSARLSEKTQCENFIINCVKFFQDIDGERLNDTIDFGDKVTESALSTYFSKKGFEHENFYEDLKTMNLFAIESYQLPMNLFTIDAYQLKLILKAMTQIEQRESITLKDIYEQICRDLNISDVDTLKQTMFNYEYNQERDIEYGDGWYKAIQHKSILEYCIAQYYSSLISRGQFNEIPNNILTDGVGRFIRLGEDRGNIKGWVESNYKNSNKYYKLAQLIFLMGCSENTKELLGQIKKNLLSKLEASNDMEEKYKIAIVLRTIYVMLIYSGDTDAAKEYFYKLIRDEDLTHANVNRGFSLDYYGDTKYIFRGENISEKYNYQQDKLFSAANTLSEISFYIDNRIKKMQQDNNALPILILQLITYYQVLQIEKQNESDLRAAREWLQEILRRPSISEYPDACEYFKQKESDVCEQLNKKCIEQEKDACEKAINEYQTKIDICKSNHHEYTIRTEGRKENEFDISISELEKQKKQNQKKKIKITKERISLSVNDKEKIKKYNKLSEMSCIMHSGWSSDKEYNRVEFAIKMKNQGDGEEYDYKIKNMPIKKKNIAESEAEHAFNCWLLGYLFLPEFMPNNKKYDKQRLLELLLFQNIIGMTEFRGKKPEIDCTYKQSFKQVCRAMEYFLGNSQCLNDWKTIWGKNNSSTAEQDKSWLMIASDIDEIQTVYQYFRYYCNGSECVNKGDDARNGMLERLKKLHTDIGKRIAKNVILLNEEFLKNNNDELREVFYKKYIEF